MAATIPIVTVNASLIEAPIPSTLQQTGAFVTQGGTNTTSDTLTSVSTLAALKAILAPALTNTSITWTSATATITTSSPHGFTTSDVIPIVVSGAVPAAYNGAFNGTVTGASTITYPLASDGGTTPASTPGTTTLGAVSELLQMGTTYFAGQGVPAVNVLELGEDEVSEGVATLTTFIENVDGTDEQQYAYLVPREWDDNTDFLTLCSNNTSVSSELYFYVTTTLANRAVYSAPAYKCVFAGVESPNKSSSEFSMASPFGTALKQNPSSSNLVPPMSYSPSYGTTAYPIKGNQSTLQELGNAYVNWIGTGQQGGVTWNIIQQGLMSDGNFWNLWYSIDWAQINMNLAIANEVINGSATSVNPLYYNQYGINRLQNRAVQVATQGVSYGLGNGQVIATKLPTSQFQANLNAGVYANQIVINAEPYTTYTALNPSDYGIGKYSGLSAIWIPQLPFLNIFFSLEATTLLTL